MEIINRHISGLRSCLITLVIILSTPSIQELKAEMICQGAACEKLPVKPGTNSLDNSFQNQYLSPLTKSMLDAAILTNINSSLMGSGLINRFELGINTSIAVVQNNDIQVKAQDFNLPELPNVGLSAAVSLNAGFNLGFLLARGASYKGYRGGSFLHRFNFFFHGSSFKYTNSNLKIEEPGVSFYGSHRSIGATIRVKLIKERFFVKKVFGFSGINVGLGLHKQSQFFSASYIDDQSEKINFGGVSGRWDANNDLTYFSNITSVPIDIKTGVRLFYFLDIFGGVGMSYNKGRGEISVSRMGSMVASKNSSKDSLADIAPEDQTAYMYSQGKVAYNSAVNNTVTASQFGFTSKASESVRKEMRFLNLGFQLNFHAFKLIVEAMAIQRSYYEQFAGALTVGMKFAL